MMAEDRARKRAKLFALAIPHTLLAFAARSQMPAGQVVESYAALSRSKIPPKFAHLFYQAAQERIEQEILPCPRGPQLAQWCLFAKDTGYFSKSLPNGQTITVMVSDHIPACNRCRAEFDLLQCVSSFARLGVTTRGA